MSGDRPSVIGAFEIRELLGVSRQRVYQFTKRADFPRPIARLTQGKVWLHDEVAAWISIRRARERPINRG